MSIAWHQAAQRCGEEGEKEEQQKKEQQEEQEEGGKAVSAGGVACAAASAAAAAVIHLESMEIGREIDAIVVVTVLEQGGVVPRAEV